TNWVMRNGWFHTDDLAYMDGDGYVFIIDRKKDLIIRGGLNVHPREVEDVLYTHPKVFDVAVVGVPDPVWGEEIMAIVLLREGEKMEPQELQEYCRDKLARYKIPRYIHFVDEIPKTSSGKLLKYELKNLMETSP
ncbi:MAG: class I adenylate-forming enzyme family protein, partial [Desulfotomaculales bacterium]